MSLRTAVTQLQGACDQNEDRRKAIPITRAEVQASLARVWMAWPLVWRAGDVPIERLPNQAGAARHSGAAGVKPAAYDRQHRHDKCLEK